MTPARNRQGLSKTYTSNKTQTKLYDRPDSKPDGRTIEMAKIEPAVLENMRLLVMRIQKGGDLPKRLSIFSSLSGEGVTSTCLALGTTLVNDYNIKTCIVDLNWYSPSPLLCEDGSNGLGITDVLLRDVPIDNVLRYSANRSLCILPGGELKEFERPSMAHGKALPGLLDELDKIFDVLILDIPAILTTSDSVHLAAFGSACCVVVRQGVTPVHDLKLALDETSHLPILGIVINRVNFKTPNSLMNFIIG